MSGLRWDGLDAMRQEGRAVPADLANAAASRIWETANTTAGRLIAAYPIGPTGNLRAGVGVALERQQVTTRALVRSSAHHALLYEYGTKPRYYKGAYRGVMPRTLIFRRTMRDATEALIQQAIADLRAAGLQVRVA